MKLPRLTPTEETLMLQLWPLGSFYLKDVMAIQPEPKPHQNTISTYLKILVEKSFLKTEKQGRIFQYTPAVSFDEYKHAVLDHFLKMYYDNEAAALIADLKNRKILKTDDMELVIKPAEETAKQPANGTNHIREMLEELLQGKKKKKKGKKKK